MMGLCRILLRCISLVVPRARRRDWLAEWSAELWYVECPLAFCLGAWPDALWFRNNEQAAGQASRWLQSPVACLAWLTAASTATGAIFFYLVRHARANWHLSGQPHDLSAYLIMVASAVIIIYATSSFALGEYPAHVASPAHARRFYRWTFLILKFALVVPLVFFLTFDVAIPLSHPVLQPHATLVGYVIAFRWALNDQRRRCPVCLRYLRESASIGQFSHNFLEWYGTELFCARGHGLLHVPQIATTYDTQRWQDLDHSWSVLFS